MNTSKYNTSVSITASDHGSTVPKARGEKSRTKINTIKMRLCTDCFPLHYIAGIKRNETISLLFPKDSGSDFHCP
jgi:hypothetical protein